MNPTPFFSGNDVTGEPLFFIQHEPASPPTARLYYPPTEIRRVISASGDKEYLVDRDFTVEGDTLRLTPGSPIPFKTPGELKPRPVPPGLPDFIRLRGEPGTGLLFGEKDFFHKLQTVVDYRHRGTWTLSREAMVRGSIPRSQAKVDARHALTLGVSGDSISAGANASKCTGAPPLQPPYAELVAAAWQARFGCGIRLKNRAVGGWTAAKGIADAPSLAAEKPDLVIVAYGMNDNTHCEAPTFLGNILAILDGIRQSNPDVEFILVCGMCGNPDWAPMHPERFPAYRDALMAQAARGVAVVDMTSVWIELLKRKSFHDLTGNGVNHPNDFGHRLYAELIADALAAS